jgi:hypothetical protein
LIFSITKSRGNRVEVRGLHLHRVHKPEIREIIKSILKDMEESPNIKSIIVYYEIVKFKLEVVHLVSEGGRCIHTIRTTGIRHRDYSEI